MKKAHITAELSGGLLSLGTVGKMMKMQILEIQLALMDFV